MSDDNDWNVEPYRFPGSEPPGRARVDADGVIKPVFGRAPPGRALDGGGGGGGEGGPKTPRPKRRERTLLKAVGAAMVGMLVAVCAYGVYLFHDLPALPSTEALLTSDRAPAMTFEDDRGEVIATRGKKTGYRVRLAELPAYVPKAFLAAEDKRFYAHGAIDLRGTLRAAVADLFHRGGVFQGGSTISQQIAKTLFLKPDRTLKRKAQEAVLAWELERRLGKDGVLELYMNRVFFGQGAYGVDAAAQTYFTKPANELSVSEAALLAALPQAPTRMSRSSNLDAGLSRSRDILQTMGEEGWITLAQLNTARGAPPTLSPPPPGDGDFGYVLDYAAAEATRIAGAGAPDLVVRLTIDGPLQTAGQTILREVVASDGRAAHASQGALVAMAPDGAIRVLVGGVDHNDSPFNRATQAHRQPGSSFKPFVYATALENGVKTTDVLVDAPIRVGGWAPTNYGGGYSGAVTVSEALARSINTIAVRLGMKVGADRIAELSRRFGMSDIPVHPDLTISLGAKEVTLTELVSGYQVFQNQGVRTTPYIIASITSARGDVFFTHAIPTQAPAPVYDPELAGRMVGMMMGVINHGTGTRAGFGREAAGKTGTSQDWRDAWFVGFTPDWAAGVWVGNDDYTPMDHVAGGTLPAAIWRRFMIEAHKGIPAHVFDWLPPPEVPPAPPPPLDEPDPRNPFYDSLAAELTDAAASDGE